MTYLHTPILSSTEFTGVSTSNTSSVVCDAGTVPGVVGPGDNSAPYTGLTLPMTSQYQYNLAHWSVAQVGNNASSIFMNGYGLTRLPGVDGRYLAIGGINGGVVNPNDPRNIPVWTVPNRRLQFNHIETIAHSYTEGTAVLTQVYMVIIFRTLPGVLPYGKAPKALHLNVGTWASRAAAGFVEKIEVDTDVGGVGSFAWTPLGSSTFVTTTSGAFAVGTSVGTPRLLIFNITETNMQTMLNQAFPAATFSAAYRTPANWGITTVRRQVEVGGSDSLTSQVGVRYNDCEANVFQD